MSTDRLARHLTNLFAPEDEALQAARRAHHEGDLPGIHVSADEGKILHVLLRAVEARRVLEVGTLGGYSGIWIARALPPGGRLVTIEGSDRYAAVARDAFERAGLADRVEVIVGEAQDTLPRIDGPFDAVFLDADKEPLPTYLDHAMRVLRVGGLLLCDNTFMDGRVADARNDAPDVRGMREFNHLVADDRRLVAAVVPVRDGLLVAVRVAR